MNLYTPNPKPRTTNLNVTVKPKLSTRIAEVHHTVSYAGIVGLFLADFPGVWMNWMRVIQEMRRRATSFVETGGKLMSQNVFIDRYWKVDSPGKS